MQSAVLVRNRDDLLSVMRKQREELGLTHLDMDAKVGLASGHYGKIERAGAAWSKTAFRMTHSVECSLEALGLELVVVPRGTIPAVVAERKVRLPMETDMPALPASRRRKPPGIVAQYRARLAGRMSATPAIAATG